MINDKIGEYLNDITSVLQGKLVIGNLESILVYGSTEQQKLSELAKDLARFYLKQGRDIEITINDILNELKQFYFPKQNHFPFSRHFDKTMPSSVLQEHYNSTLNYLEKLSVELKLQEAEIIKENNLLKHFYSQINQCSQNFQNCIDEGNVLILSQKKVCDDESEDIKEWWIKLDQRIHDLKLSHTVAKQMQVQIKLLINNNQEISDTIINFTTKSIPLWKKQTKAFLIILADYSYNKQINTKLYQELKLLSDMEKKDVDIRRKIKKYQYKRSNFI